jgi:hypothetical protein
MIQNVRLVWRRRALLEWGLLVGALVSLAMIVVDLTHGR